MQTLLDKLLPLRNADDGGGAGAGDGAGDQSPADGSGAGDGGQAGQDGGNPPLAAGPSGPYRPDGLPDTMFGKDDRETIDKLHQAVKGYRDRDGQRQVPETAEAYRAFKLDDAPESVRPHLEALANDPLFDAVAQLAHEEKVPTATLQRLTTKLYEQAAEMGILDHVVDTTKERASLLPETARNLPKNEQDRQIDARLQANEDWVKLQIQHGLPEDVASHGLLMLMDTAAGNQLIEYFRSKIGGDRDNPLPGDGGGAGAGRSQRDQLRARLAAPEMQAGHPAFDRAAYDQLMADYQRIVGA